ncbi:MAG: hypothetical protein LLG37_07750 [Spirochaetia bacterium]|nr:hypothetical protein [Spirochaetia bacterium]
MKKGLMKGLPVNMIAALSLGVFLTVTGLMMYYNNNALVFPDIEAYLSLNKAGEIADSDFLHFFNPPTQGKKESNGFLYPAVLSVFHKILGRANMVPFILVIDLTVFALLLALFYRIARIVLPGGMAQRALAAYSLTAPVVLGAFSGSDAVLSMTAFMFCLYFAVTSVEAKKYTGLVVSACVLALTGYIGAAFAACFLTYALLKKCEKAVRKNYIPAISRVFGILAIFFCLLFFYVFVEKFSAEYLRNNGFFDIKTYTVDSFFKDGFLWSKVLPPFFTVFYFVALFVMTASEAGEKKAGPGVLFCLLSMTALLVDFFSMFAPGARSYIYLAQFFPVVILPAVKGIHDVAVFLDDRKIKGLRKESLITGFMIFFLLYSAIFTFNRVVEADAAAQYIVGDSKVSKYLEN